MQDNLVAIAKQQMTLQVAYNATNTRFRGTPCRAMNDGTTMNNSMVISLKILHISGLFGHLWEFCLWQNLPVLLFEGGGGGVLVAQ